MSFAPAVVVVVVVVVIVVVIVVVVVAVVVVVIIVVVVSPGFSCFVLRSFSLTRSIRRCTSTRRTKS
jgi:hypothetical protein